MTLEETMPKIPPRFLTALVAILFVTAGLSEHVAQGQEVTTADLEQAAGDTSSWLMYGRDYHAHRYVELEQITPDNVGNLHPVWVFATGGANRGLEATPLLHEGVTEDRMQFERFVDMRYLGQWRPMSIKLDARAGSLEAAIAQFHEEHGREHNYSRPDAPVEIYRLTVTATGLSQKAEFAREEVDRTAPAPETERPVVFDEAPEAIMTPIYDRDNLHAGAVIEGPAIIEQLDSTVLVPPGLKAEVDPWHTIVMHIPQAEG